MYNISSLGNNCVKSCSALHPMCAEPSAIFPAADDDGKLGIRKDG